MFDNLIVILVLLALSFPIIAIIALVIAIDMRGAVHRLEQRVRMLELGAPPAVAPARAAAAAPPAPPPPAPQAAAAAAEPPAPPSSPPSSPTRHSSPQPPPPGSVPAAPAPRSPPQQIGFEERFGTRWVVWVGGVALALGGIFLVRYTIQEGLIGPRVRIFLGALLALALVVAGEWTRRRENLSSLSGLPSPNIPSILTAAGTTVGLCDRLRRLCALRIPAAARRFHFARHRRAADAGRRAAAWPGTRGPRRHRWLLWRRPGGHRQAGLLGAVHLHRGRHCGRICARAGACGTGLPSRRLLSALMDFPGCRRVPRRRRSAPMCSTRLRGLC